MDLTTGARLHGFTVTRIREAGELKAPLVEMVHDRAGTELCWLDSGESNKLFAAVFRTPPEDDTGVFHILEHSLLCGSEQYPVREPFVELLKSSMQTYLNALTFSDKTMFPVSSRNEKDFLNLVSVYLDAVFAPRILDEPNIFYQEGWHIALEGDKTAYSGVVLNEMKGDQNVGKTIHQGMNRLLFPDTCYRFSYGGDPAAIPDLTYQRFTETYHRFYHPSNARIYLDGSVPLEQTLALIDRYLSRAERRTDLPQIVMQQPVSGTGMVYYEIAPNEEVSGKTYLAMGRIVGTWADRVRCLAIQILCSALADSNEAPLTRAVLDSGLGQAVSLSIIDDIAQPWLSLCVQNIAEGQADGVRQLIHDTACRLAAEGLDRAALEASLNQMEFHVRQAAEPGGFKRCMQVLSSWLYGGDPLQNLSWDGVFEQLRSMLDSGGFEALLSELFADSSAWSVLQAVPSPTLGEEMRAREAERLETERAAWSEEQWAACRRLNERLALWQQTPDTPEQISTLPMLTLDEIGDVPEFPETGIETVCGVTVLRHPASCHGVVHLAMYFPLTDFTLEELTKLSILPRFLGNFPTRQHGAFTLHQRIKSVFGSMRFGMRIYARPDQTERATPCLAAFASVLESNLPDAIELIREIMTETRFDEPERIRNLVIQSSEGAKASAAAAGQQTAMCSALACYSAQNAVQEAIGGRSYHQWIQRFAENFEAEIAPFISFVKQAADRVIGRERMVVSVTADHDIPADALISIFPEGKSTAFDAEYHIEQPYMRGIRIPAQVGCAVRAYHLSRCGQTASGSLYMAAQILSLNYLWNSIRVQGGAYGAGMTVGRAGNLCVYSYRDPSPHRSLKAYDGLAEALRSFCKSGEPLDKYIIAAVSQTEPLMSPQEYGLTADHQWFSGITREDETRFRQELLHTDAAALLDWAETLEHMAEEGTVCVVGPDEMLKACGGDVLEICNW